MKTRKALAVLLAVVLLVVPLTLSSFAATEITSSAIKTVYNDSEHFNPQGLVISDGTNSIEYSPVDSDFRFDPALDKLLTVDTESVRVFYKDEYVGSIDVTVEHVLGELVSIDNGHGHYCLGCGTLCDFEEHNVEEYIPNDDAGFFTCQTETGTCTVCGGKVTRSIEGTEKFTQIFDFENMTETEAEIIGYFYNIVVTLIQALVGIY